MTDAFELLVVAESLVVAVSGVVIAYTAATNRDVVLYPSALVLAGSGLVVGGTAAVLAVGGSTSHDALVLAAGVTFCLAGWRLATDAASASDPGTVLHAGETVGDGFGGERE